jgi:hypothetical protein
MPCGPTPVVIAGLGSEVLDGFCGVVVASVLMDGFFFPQLSQSMLGALMPLLQPGVTETRPTTAIPANQCRSERVRILF